MDQPPKISKILSKSFNQVENLLLLHTGSLYLAQAIAQMLYYDLSRLIILIDLPDQLISQINYHLHLIKREKVIQKSDHRMDSPEVIPLNKVVKGKRNKMYLEGGIYSLTLQIILLDVLSYDHDLNPHLINRLIIFHKHQGLHDKFQHVPFLATLMNLNSNRCKIVFVSCRLGEFRGENLERIIRLLFLKRVVIWPFGRKEIHESIKNSSLPSISHRLALNPYQCQIKLNYEKLIKYCTDSELDQRQINCLQSTLLDLNKLTHFQRVRELCSKKFGIWNSSSSRILDLLDGIDKEAKNCVYNLKLMKDQEGKNSCRSINLKQLIQLKNANNQKFNKLQAKKLQNSELMQIEEDQKSSDPQQSQNQLNEPRSQKQWQNIQFQLSYDLNVVGLKDESEIKNCLYPVKFLHLINYFHHKLQDEEKKQSQTLELLVITERQKTAQYLTHYTQIYASQTQYVEYLRQILRQLECTRGSRRQSIIKVINKMTNSKNNGKSNFGNLKILDDEQILLEQLFQELKQVDQMMIYYSTQTDKNVQLFEKEVDSLELRYISKNILKSQFCKTKQNPTDGIIIMNQVGVRFVFQPINSIYQLSCILRVLCPEYCIFYNFNPTFIRFVTIQYSQGNLISLKQLHAIFFEGSSQDEEIQKKIKGEDEDFWRIAEERKKLGQFFEEAETRIRQLIIDDEIEKKARMINMGEELKKNKREDNLVMNPDKLLRIKVQRTILVDKRQFKSLLPSYLFHYGFKIIPVFLEVGDYILSNQIALEKKSVQTYDLHESLRSGRLSEQSKKMILKFNKPYLLIECGDQSFFTPSYLNSQVNKTSGERYQSNTLRLTNQLLTKYPKMGVMWSCGYLQSIELIMKLKRNEHQPELHKFVPQNDIDPDFDESDI